MTLERSGRLCLGLHGLSVGGDRHDKDQASFVPGDGRGPGRGEGASRDVALHDAGARTHQHGSRSAP
ncbi:hypothetical protein L541_1509 [Bordetella hinzii CA90 BAL1384]|nr:hypothetical protein L541_1509 [Bordetella hinzii CA90 BAL1384]KCB45744.1 hypothetical protein L539_4099 [Bordetella hinzii 5132]